MCDVSQTMEWAQSVACADLQDGDVVATHAIAGGGPEIRVRALRPTLHPEIADAVEAHHHEALRRHDIAGMVSVTSPLRTMSATWQLVAEAPGNGCMAGFRGTGLGRVCRLAEIVAGFCLPLELSSYAAMVTGAFAAAHGHLGRKPGG